MHYLELVRMYPHNKKSCKLTCFFYFVTETFPARGRPLCTPFRPPAPDTLRPAAPEDEVLRYGQHVRATLLPGLR